MPNMTINKQKSYLGFASINWHVNSFQCIVGFKIGLLLESCCFPFVSILNKEMLTYVDNSSVMSSRYMTDM